MTQYAVHGEDRKGDPYKLRTLQTKRDAEMHMRRLESEPQWRRLWIEPAPKKRARPVRPEGPPPFPWRATWFNGFAYVEDANGHKLAVLLGPNDVREYVAARLMEMRA